jgi:hypothetical protein
MGAVDKAAKQNRKGKVVQLEEPLNPRGGKKIPNAQADREVI